VTVKKRNQLSLLINHQKTLSKGFNMIRLTQKLIWFWITHNVLM